MTRSNSKQAYLAFCEGLLQETPGLSSVQQYVTSAREHAFMNGDSGSSSSSSSHDWFSQFPAPARPTDAVIIAGAGATSTLHRDPFDWTGTSLCLEGTKVWRFIEPPPTTTIIHNDDDDGGVKRIDQQLDSYRLESIAWRRDNDDDDNDHNTGTMSLSAGWQSDYSLYHSRRHESIPSARELAELAETDPSQYETLLQEVATNMDILRPCDDAAAQQQNNSNTFTIHTAIQKPGDLLLIPAHWWHQTYALEPSVAVASQRCSALDAPRVFEHILHQVVMAMAANKNNNNSGLRQQNVSSTVSSILGLGNNNASTTSQEAIDELFRIVQDHSNRAVG
jgi:Cupin-like domain